MSDKTVTLTREEAAIIEAGLRRHLKSLRCGAAGRNIKRRLGGNYYGALAYAIRDTESAIRKLVEP